MTSTGLPVHQIDIDTYERIVASGALDGQHVELIDGIITEVSPQSPEHAAVVQRLGAYLAAYNAHGLLRVKAPLHVTAANSLPEPDLAVTAEPSDPREHPREAVLVIEVAVSTQALDRGRKQELYAAIGIPTYLLVDVPARTVEVRTSPGDSGYDALTVYPDGASVSALSSGEDPLSLASLFVGL